MYFLSSTTALLLGTFLATTTPSVNAQKLGKRELTVQPTLEPYYDKFNTLLPEKSYTFSTWNAGHLPTSCVWEAQNNNHPCPLNQMQAYSVKYSDCPKVWNMCRCSTAPQTRDSMFKMFGRLPVGTRSYVRIFMGMTPWTGIAAYAVGSDMATVSSLWHMGTLIHEVSHVIDYGLGWVSSSSEFKSAVDADSCVLVAYGNNNYVENFAVMANLVLLEVLDPAGYNELKGKLENFTCLSKGLAVVRKYLRPAFQPQTTCPARVPGDGTSTYVRRRRNLIGKTVGQVVRRQHEVPIEDLVGEEGLAAVDADTTEDELSTRIVIADPASAFEYGTSPAMH